jgi:hypothetical protein
MYAETSFVGRAETLDENQVQAFKDANVEHARRTAGLNS